MDNRVLFLQGQLVERIWGSQYFKDNLHLTTSDQKYGEYWTASARSEADAIIVNGDYQGWTLSKLFAEVPTLFAGIQTKAFPLLIKIISTSDVLSVQVHPNDAEAIKDNDRGKYECWLILDCEQNSQIIYGHHAPSLEALRQSMQNNTMMDNLNSLSVHPGMFIKVPAGCIHAIGKNIVLVEIQQASNLTYRLYDYNRLGSDGKPRTLHVEQALSVIQNSQLPIDQVNYLHEMRDALLWHNDYFDAWLLDVASERLYETGGRPCLLTNIGKPITIFGMPLAMGQSCLIPSNTKQVLLSGPGKLIAAYSNE